MKKRIRHGDPRRRSYWEEVVRRWREGGQSVRAFCRARNCGSRPSISGGINWREVVTAPASGYPVPWTAHSSSHARRRQRRVHPSGYRHGMVLRLRFCPCMWWDRQAGASARLRRTAAWRLSWGKAARYGCRRASTGKRSPLCWPCWRCSRVEPVGTGADLRVLGADRYAKKFRHTGRPGAGLAGIRSLVRPLVRVPQSPWRSRETFVVGSRRADVVLSAAGRRNLSLSDEQRPRRAGAESGGVFIVASLTVACSDILR